jgi:hypothetical protein
MLRRETPENFGIVLSDNSQSQMYALTIRGTDFISLNKTIIDKGLEDLLNRL